MKPRTPRRLLPALLVSVALCVARPAAAWNDAGHMLTALVAWEQMDDRSRAWAVGLLEQHPRFAQDFTRRMPPELDSADRGRWVFAHAATWPDIARRFEGEDAERYHRSTWHYGLNLIPLDDDGERPATHPATRAAATRPATRPGDLHVVDALGAALRQLHAADLPPADKAVSLCWLLHLIGDVHQPCHAGSLVSGRFGLPEGDRGANNIAVEGEGRANNLHAVWDGIAGDNRAFAVLAMKLDRLVADPTLARRALPELRRHPAAADWIAESAALSRDAVYDFSVRAAVRLQEVDPQSPFVPLRLSRNYVTDAQLIAHRRIALAGHRIADAVRGTAAAVLDAPAR